MICVINAGSTSIKYKVFSKKLKKLREGKFSDITINAEIFSKIVEELSKEVTSQAVKVVAHRVVHGGSRYHEPTRITEEILQDLKSYNHLAPLHNPRNIRGIELARSAFPKAAHYAIFDTGFFSSLPDKARLYPIPLLYAEMHGIQRYGFHGISHQYALQRAGESLRKTKPSLITIHLGGGCSITAIKKGMPIDTSMGYTPMEGLMMWSRAGDMDPGILLETAHPWEKILNSESGIKGITGCNNYLDVLSLYRKKDPNARLAIDMFVYRIQKYIGAYWGALSGKVDAVVFTGRIGAGDVITRRLVLKGLPFLKNVPAIALQPNEEWMMAKAVMTNCFN